MLILLGGFAIVQVSVIYMGYVRGKEDGIETTSSYFREIMLKRQIAYRFNRTALPYAGSKSKIGNVKKQITHNKKLIG